MACISDDINKGVLTSNSPKPGREGLLRLLNSRNTRIVTLDGWKKIDTEEKRRGNLKNKPREKLTTWEELLKVACGWGSFYHLPWCALSNHIYFIHFIATMWYAILINSTIVHLKFSWIKSLQYWSLVLVGSCALLLYSCRRDISQNSSPRWPDLGRKCFAWILDFNYWTPRLSPTSRGTLL